MLEVGRHEASCDRYDAAYSAWSYAVRGRTIDGRELRIVVAFDEDDDQLVLVTTRDLDQEQEERRGRR